MYSVHKGALNLCANLLEGTIGRLPTYHLGKYHVKVTMFIFGPPFDCVELLNVIRPWLTLCEISTISKLAYRNKEDK